MVKDFVKVCPRCGSINISFNSLSLGNAALNNGGLQDYCIDCEYGKFNLNSVFPEIKKTELNKFRKKIKNKNKM